MIGSLIFGTIVAGSFWLSLREEDNWLDTMKLHWDNSQKVIAQLDNNEWEFKYSEHTEDYSSATRKGQRLCTYFCFDCDINGRNMFGYILRNYVYFRGVWPNKRKIKRSTRNKLKVIKD